VNYVIAAKWPNESRVDGGSHIGLMMFPTTTADAWNWLTNTTDGVNLFSGAPSPNKISIATSYIADIVSGTKGQNAIPAHLGLAALSSPQQVENMALVLYRGTGLGPVLANTLGELYYIRVCTGAIKATSKGWTCSSSWYWAVNDPTVDSNVQAKYIFPPGANGLFTNHVGVAYVSNYILFTDTNLPKGARDLLQ
jgi:hypothetical protein